MPRLAADVVRLAQGNHHEAFSKLLVEGFYQFHLLCLVYGGVAPRFGRRCRYKALLGRSHLLQGFPDLLIGQGGVQLHYQHIGLMATNLPRQSGQAMVRRNQSQHFALSQAVALIRCGFDNRNAGAGNLLLQRIVLRVQPGFSFGGR